MHAIRQKCRPKHQVLILKCYPRTIKGAVDVKPNSSELSYLLYYATTRRSKVQKVGAFLEKKTASDVWRARIGNVQVTLQIIAALIEKAPRDLPLYAPYVLKILNIILRSRDITMAEASIPTFQAFCEHHDGASLSADQEYLNQYEDIVNIYASFASVRPPPTKNPISAPVALRWRGVGLEAIKSIVTSEILVSQAAKQLDVIVPILLENLWTDDLALINMLQHRARVEEKVDTERLLRRRTSIATVRTAESTEANAAALSGTTADADKLAEEDIGVVAIQCLKAIFVVNNRAQIYMATTATLNFIAARVTQKEMIVQGWSDATESRGWATRIFDMIARWAPVQDRYVILVTAMDVLVSSPLAEDNLQQQLVLATMIDSLLKSDVNLIGLSVMDVLLGLVQHVLRTLQLRGAVPHLQPDDATDNFRDSEKISATDLPSIGRADSPTDLRRDLLERLQSCIGDLATHVYYADQISDMVTAILLRLKPSPLSAVPNGAVAVENPGAASAAVTSVGDMAEDPTTDGFFSFDTAKIKALEAIKAILIVASKRRTMSGGGNLGRNQVPIRVWEGTQWLLRDPDGRVRKTYVDALHIWLEYEMTRSDLRVSPESPKISNRATRDDSATLTRRAVSNASHREKTAKPSRTNFLRLLHLAIYENALQYVESETDIVLLHFLLAKLVGNLGVNAVKDGLPMIFRLQEDILDAETPIAKIRMGSLCHGYFWLLSETFDFESSPVGRSVHNEIHRRRSKSFWVDRVRLPPIPLEHIATPGRTTPQETLPLHKVETESLNPFDDRFQMVKLISLSYSASFASPASSPPTSPGRSFNQPILNTSSAQKDDPKVPEKIKDEMMSEWTRDSVIAAVQEGSKTVSLNGSKTGTNATGHRNFLAVNGSRNGGTNSGSQSPQRHSHAHNSHGSKPPSTYGLVGGLGALQKIRKDSGQSPSPASESSRNSVTRVDQLKRILSGQQKPLEGTRGGLAYSDASSDSMVSFDYTASEASYNHNQQKISVMDHAASQPAPRERSRSKSRDRTSTDHKALTSHPVLTPTDPNVPHHDDNPNNIPPVPTIPAALTTEGTTTQDHTVPERARKSRSMRRSTKSRGGQSVQEGPGSWGSQSASIADLESLLKGIDVRDGDQTGDVAKPPY